MSSTNPYNYPFIQKDNTMYLSTISTTPYIQPNKTSPASLPSIAKAHSSREIFLVPLPRSSSPKAAPPTSSSPPTLNRYLIEANTFKRHRILSTLMISKGPGPSALTLEPEELWIHSAPSTCSHQPPKSSLTTDGGLSETLSSAMT